MRTKQPKKTRQYPKYTSAELAKYANFIIKIGVSKCRILTGISTQTLTLMSEQKQKTYKRSTQVRMNDAMEIIRVEEIGSQEIDHPSALLKPIDPNALPTLPEPTIFVVPNNGVSADVQALIDIHSIMESLDQGGRNSVLNWFVYKYQQGNN